MIYSKSSIPTMSLAGNNVTHCFESVVTIKLLSLQVNLKTQAILFIICFARCSKMFAV